MKVTNMACFNTAPTGIHEIDTGTISVNPNSTPREIFISITDDHLGMNSKYLWRSSAR